MGTSDEPYEVTSSWFARDGSDWVLTFRLKSVNGRTECVGMGISSFADRERMTALRLREVPFGRELERAWSGGLARDERLRDLVRRFGGDIPDLGPAPLLASGKPRQRRKYTTRDYLQASAVYSELCKGPHPSKSPTRDAAEALGLRPDQAAKLIQRCRSMGFLPPTDPGVARGSTEEDG